MNRYKRRKMFLTSFFYRHRIHRWSQIYTENLIFDYCISIFIFMNVNEVTEKIIGSAYTVSKNLGFGFLEKVYENAMILELKDKGLKVENQKSLKVFYRNQVIGDYYADLYVENSIIVELKSTKAIEESHKAQLLNYLKASNKRYGLLLNFGKDRLEIKRIVNGY